MAEEKRGDPKVMWAVYGLAQLAGVSAVICTVAWLMARDVQFLCFRSLLSKFHTAKSADF